MSNVLRVGIVGCREVARVWHIPPLLKIRGVEIAAVCDMNEQAAKQAAERIGTGSYYVDISDMLRRAKLDIVDICTPPPQPYTALYRGTGGRLPCPGGEADRPEYAGGR